MSETHERGTPRTLTLDERMARGQARFWERNVGLPKIEVPDHWVEEATAERLVGTLWKKNRKRGDDVGPTFEIVEFSELGQRGRVGCRQVLFVGEKSIRVKRVDHRNPGWIWLLRPFLELHQRLEIEGGE